MDLSTFETDRQLEVDGVWVDIGDEDETQLLIARIGNPNYNRLIRARLKPHKNLLQRDALPMEMQEKILNEVIAETVLLGWKNLKYKGKKINYSSDRALEMLNNISDFRELVMEIANSMETFRIVETEEDVKNSKAS